MLKKVSVFILINSFKLKCLLNLLFIFRYISPISQISITAILTSVEIVIIVVTFWYNTPIVTHIYPTRDSRIRICNGIGDYSYLIDLFYPFILIGKYSLLVTTIHTELFILNLPYINIITN